MKGALFLLFLLCTMHNLGASVTKLSEQKKAEIKEDLMGVTIVNNNNHKIEVKNQTDPYDCLQHIGDQCKFKEFMRWLPKDELKKNLIKIDKRIRDCYEESLTPLQAEEVLITLGDGGKSEIKTKLGTEGDCFLIKLQKKVDYYYWRKKSGPTWTELGMGVCRVLVVFASLER